MSEWHYMQEEPNTKLRDLLKSKQAKTRKPNGLSKTEQNRLAMLDGVRHGKSILSKSHGNKYNTYNEK